MTSTNLKKSIVSLIEDQIIHIHLKSNQEIELSDAAETLEAMGELSNHKKMPVLIDVGDFVNLNDDVRAFSASKAGNIYTIADAIAVHNVAQKLLANFYLKNDDPKVPTKIFGNKHDALAWLKTFIK